MDKFCRLWSITDGSLNYRLELLYKRPRIDYRISEYIFEYINKNILEPKKIMQKGNNLVCFSFSIWYKDKQKYSEDSLYNTEETTYSYKIFTMTEDRIKYKQVQLFCYSTKLNENIKPKEYANMVYDMVGAFLIDKFKKVTKEIMDKNKTGIDYKIIEKFKYPALAKDQKYLCDELTDSRKYVLDDRGIKICINEYAEYIKYYGE
jgi:hypothetical protein